MSFDTPERSAQLGQPLEAYEFEVTPPQRIGSVVHRGLDGDPVQELAPWAWELHCTSLGSTPPPSFHPSGQAAFFRTAFSCSIAESGAFRRHVATLTGFQPNKKYRFQLRFRVTPSPGGTTVTGMQLLATGHTQVDAFTGGDIVADQLASAAGEITVRIGLLNLEFGATIWAFTVGQLVVTALPASQGGSDPGSAPPTTTYGFTSADTTFVHAGTTFLKAEFVRQDEFQTRGAESADSEIRVGIPRAHELADLLRAGFPPAAIRCRVLSLHRSDLTEARVPLQGEVLRWEQQGPTMVLVLGGKGRRLDQRLPTLTTGRLCPNVLYDLRCRVLKAQFAYTAGVVTAIAGRVITVSGAGAFPRPAGDPEPEGYFEGGTLQTPTGAEVTIESADGDAITVGYVPAGLAVDDPVTLTAGCPKTPEVCHGRFANLVNHLGEPGMPVRNPFSSTGLV